jgi:hypothetical protein
MIFTAIADCIVSGAHIGYVIGVIKIRISLMHHIVFRSEIIIHSGKFEPSGLSAFCNRVGSSRGFKGFHGAVDQFVAVANRNSDIAAIIIGSDESPERMPSNSPELPLKEVLECKSSVRLSAAKPHSKPVYVGVSSAFLKDAAIIAEEDVTCSASSVVTCVSSGGITPSAVVKDITSP